MFTRLQLFYILSFLLICSLFQPARAQDVPGKRDSIFSAILNQKRIIQVVLPANYKPGAADKYDVIYVLDDDNIKTIADVQYFVQKEGFMPPVIIVGIINIDRDHDFLAVKTDDGETGGGASQFLSFIKNELVPYINKTYPSDGDNTLFGHSYGGLFAMYALLNEPQVFNCYIAADPSFWYDKKSMIKMAMDKLPALANLNKTLYMTGREGEGMVGMGIVSMDSVLKKYAPTGFTWKIMPYPNETHGSVRLKSIYDGLRFVYSGYKIPPPDFGPQCGVVIKDKPYKIWFTDDTSMIRYTTDGTPPTLASPVMKSVLTLTGPQTLTVTAFSNRPVYTATSSGIFTEGTYLPALKNAKGLKPGGFHYNYYEGTWDRLPDFKTLKPVKSGFADSTFSIYKLPRKTDFALTLEGEIEIKEDGYYLFGLLSDDGSRLYINNKLIIDHDGISYSGVGKSYLLPLKKGFYPVRMEYFQKEGDYYLKLLYVTPAMANMKDIKVVPIPFELQYGWQ